MSDDRYNHPLPAGTILENEHGGHKVIVDARTTIEGVVKYTVYSLHIASKQPNVQTDQDFEEMANDLETYPDWEVLYNPREDQS